MPILRSDVSLKLVLAKIMMKIIIVCYMSLKNYEYLLFLLSLDRSKVEDIVLVYLRHAEVLTALECVKAFVFEELLELTAGKTSLKTPLMCWDLCFMAGSSGGIIVMRSATMYVTEV